MKQTLHFLIIFTFVGLMSSCNKDDDAPPATRQQTVSEKKWITTALTINPSVQFEEGGPQITDLYGFYQSQGGACLNDDIKFFKINGTYTFEEGATKCNPANPQVYESGTWLMSSDESALVTNVGGISTSYDIITLDATTLVWRYVIPTQNAAYILEETHTILNQ